MSHQFFKRYGSRFEDSEGKQIFLEFADEERGHLDMLLREYIILTKKKPGARSQKQEDRRQKQKRKTKVRSQKPEARRAPQVQRVFSASDNRQEALLTSDNRELALLTSDIRLS